MPNKQLTAKVKLNTSDVETKLRNLETRIKNIQRVLNGGGSAGGIDTKMARAAIQAEKVNQAVARTALQQQKVATESAKTATQQERLTQAQLRTQQMQDNVTNSANSTNAALTGVEGILGSISNQNGQWKLDMEGIVSSVGAMIPGYGGVISALSPIIAEVADWLGITEMLEKMIEGIMKAIKSVLNVLTFGRITINEIKDKVRDWWEEQKRVAKESSKTNDVFDNIWGKVQQIVGALISVGTIKVAIEAADTLTGAENRLNNIAHNVFGDSAYTKSGDAITGYSKKALNFTQEAMDKMYVAAKNSRSLYSDMMNNVSKTMTLAGDAFDNNIDNAIRFQEVMSKSFAISGASAQEISTSMYQLTQALGSGVLQGDELRSVREGAALAYQEIEKFAQGVLNTEESLKDLASQGKITSDMVVAAILNMGDEIDQQFAMTEWRFSEVWSSIQSAAQRAFQPVVKQLTTMLNNVVDNGLIEQLENIFVDLSKAIMIVFDMIEKGINWVKNNWDAFDVINEKTGEIEKSAYGLRDVVVGVLIALGTYFAITGLIAVWNALVAFTAWVAVNWPLLLIVGTLALLIWQMYKGGDAAGEVALQVLQALKWIGLGLIILGILSGNLTMGIIGGILLIIGILASNLSPEMGKIAGTIAYVAGVAWNAVVKVVNFISGLVSYITASSGNIKNVFVACWHGIQAAFWNFVGDVVDGIGEIIMALNPLLNAIGKSGVSFSTTLGIRQKADYHAGLAGGITNSPEFKAGEILQEVDPNAWKAWATETFSSEENFKKNVGSIFDNAGAAVDTWIKEKLKIPGGTTDEGDGSGDNLSLVDQIMKKLGLNYNDFPTEEELKDTLKSAGAPKELLDSVDDISGNTGSIADSMELTTEDLEYLRKVAEMEWKKEFTTANITVDMSNYNTINGENDLDGIVTKLTDKLYEELDYMANGVYAY